MFVTTSVTSYFQGTAYFNVGQQGWSDTVAIPETTSALALLALKKYIKNRMWLLPAAVSCVYARVTKVPHQRLSEALEDLPLPGLAATLTTPNANDSNDVAYCPVFHMKAEEGAKSIRFIHGVPDDVIVARAFATAPPGGSWIDLVGAPTDGTANPGTWAAALKALLSYTGQSFCCPSQLKTVTIGGVPGDGYRLRAYTGILSRNARGHKVGRPFGMSRGKAPIR